MFEVLTMGVSAAVLAYAIWEYRSKKRKAGNRPSVRDR